MSCREEIFSIRLMLAGYLIDLLKHQKCAEHPVVEQ